MAIFDWAITVQIEAIFAEYEAPAERLWVAGDSAAGQARRIIALRMACGKQGVTAVQGIEFAVVLH